MATFQMAMKMRYIYAPPKVKKTKRFGLEQFTHRPPPGQYQFCRWDLEMLQVAPRYLSAIVTSLFHRILCSLQVLLWNCHPMSRPLPLVTQHVAGDDRGSLTTYWGFNVAKSKRNRGQVYKTRNGKPVGARAIKPSRGEGCRFKCHTDISSDRELITFRSKES